MALDTRGRISITNGSEVKVFRAVRIDPIGPIVIAVGWEKLELSINGRDITEDSGEDALVLAGGRGGAAPHWERFFLTLDPSVGTVEESFFLHTILDLDERVHRGTSYDLIKAAGLLRLLLIDGNCLIHQINRTHRLRLRFVVSDWADSPRFPEGTQRFSLEPFAKTKTKTVDQAGLLSEAVLVWQGGMATVRDLIKACANSRGGVHLGPPEDGGQSVLLESDRDAQITDVDLSLAGIRDVCAVVFRGVVPLVQAIQEAASLRSTGSNGSG